ncbi:MAG: V-type ATPase subunit [Eubacteriales bacterium]|nr:V-type ATPase subunit [Eubacteriales bacterium]
MPQGSLNYAVARVKSREGRLLTADRLERMVDAPSAEEALRLLAETGYGAQAGGDYEKMAEWELAQAASFVESVTPDERVTDLFLMRGDYQNMKAAYKMRALGVNAPEALTQVSKFPPQLMVDTVAQQNYVVLPEHMQEATAQAELLLSTGVDPRALDLLLDGAWLRWAVQQSRKADAFVREYFTAMTDFANASLVLRAPHMGEDAEFVRGQLTQGGRVPRELWLALYAREAEALGELGKIDRALAVKFDAAQNGGKLWEFEKYRDDTLLDMARDGRSELFTIRPLVGYLLAKEAEARAVRMVMTAKSNRIPRDILRERLRGLYV